MGESGCLASATRILPSAPAYFFCAATGLSAQMTTSATAARRLVLMGCLEMDRDYTQAGVGHRGRSTIKGRHVFSSFFRPRSTADTSSLDGRTRRST